MQKVKRGKIKKCPAKYSFDYITIDFNGFGIKVLNESNLTSDFVLVEYFGEIGKSNFEFKIEGDK